MLTKELIIEKLNTLQEHKMAKDIFVPVFKKMGLKGVKFTGGPNETGIDIEYYEVTQPEGHKKYTGMQFKKGDISYGAGGGNGTVKEIKNQAEEAFEKEIHDTDGRSATYIFRFIVATTGQINETARKYIGKARQKGEGHRIDYWEADRIAEYIQDYWSDEFIKYFSLSGNEEAEADDEDNANVVDALYIEENFKDLVLKCKKLYSTLGSIESSILSYLVTSDSSAVADLLFEMEMTEDSIREELQQLGRLGYIEMDGDQMLLTGNSSYATKLFSQIQTEIEEAGEDSDPAEIYNEIV